VSPDLSEETPEPTEPDSTESDAAAAAPTAPAAESPTAEVSIAESTATVFDSVPADNVAETSGGRPPFVVTVAAALALVIALAAAAWFGTGWVRAAYFTDGPRAEARDSALTDARQAAINLMSMDPSDVDGSIKMIQSSMTGQLLDEATKGQEQLRSTASESKTKLAAKVLGASLTSLNSERDRASALVVLQVTRSVPNNAPVSFRQSWTLNMIKGGAVWKAETAESLGQPVPLDAPKPGEAAGQPPVPAAPAPAPPTKPGS
jgi:Mce-associated membrane protein